MDKMSSAHVYLRLRKVFGYGIQESRVTFRNDSEREIAGRRVGLHLGIAVKLMLDRYVPSYVCMRCKSYISQVSKLLLFLG